MRRNMMYLQSSSLGQCFTPILKCWMFIPMVANLKTYGLFRLLHVWRVWKHWESLKAPVVWRMLWRLAIPQTCRILLDSPMWSNLSCLILAGVNLWNGYSVQQALSGFQCIHHEDTSDFPRWALAPKPQIFWTWVDFTHQSCNHESTSIASMDTLLQQETAQGPGFFVWDELGTEVWFIPVRRRTGSKFRSPFFRPKSRGKNVVQHRAPRDFGLSQLDLPQLNLVKAFGKTSGKTCSHV